MANVPLFDDNGQFMGHQSSDRERVHSQSSHENHGAAAVIIFNGNSEEWRAGKKVLYTQASEKDGRLRSKLWDPFAGGHLLNRDVWDKDNDYSPYSNPFERAASREIKEELKLDVLPSEFFSLSGRNYHDFSGVFRSGWIDEMFVEVKGLVYDKEVHGEVRPTGDLMDAEFRDLSYFDLSNSLVDFPLSFGEDVIRGAYEMHNKIHPVYAKVWGRFSEYLALFNLKNKKGRGGLGSIAANI